MVSYHNDNGTLEVRHRHEVIRIQAWGADSVRVRAAQYRIPAESAGALGDTPPDGTTSQVKVEGTRAALVNGRLRVEVTFDTTESYPEPLITFRDHGRGRAAGRAPRALLDAGRAGLRRQPVGCLRDPPAVRRLPGGAALRPGPADPRAARTSRASPWTSSSATARSASRSCCRTAATGCCGTCPPSAGPSSRRTPPAGRPGRPARSTTGSPRRRPRRRSSPGTRTPPATRPSCPRGPAGSGSPSSATARRTSCSTSPASTSAAACRCR